MKKIRTILTAKLVSKNIKVKIHKTTIVPTWIESSPICDECRWAIEEDHMAMAIDKDGEHIMRFHENCL